MYLLISQVKACFEEGARGVLQPLSPNLRYKYQYWMHNLIQSSRARADPAEKPQKKTILARRREANKTEAGRTVIIFFYRFIIILKTTRANHDILQE